MLEVHPELVTKNLRTSTIRQYFISQLIKIKSYKFIVNKSIYYNSCIEAIHLRATTLLINSIKLLYLQ
jgi:hypothetical protein